MSKKWFPKIDNEESAKEVAKQGAYGVLVFVAMTLLGAVFMYFAGQSPVDGSTTTQEDVINQIIGTIILIPIQLIMAWRIYKGKGWLASIIVLLWFIVEISLKIVGGTSNVGWFLFYIFIILMLVNGFRGCWYLRGASKNSEPEIA
ncbi:MAG: hypothetical protein IPG64_25505 [Haliea sp.]|nr:hypothetical protein [Haliea sp.]